MPGILRCDKIDYNNLEVVRTLKQKLKDTVNESTRHNLLISKKYYFRLDKQITTNPGWYVILENKSPLYVGKAENLNSRINSENGSRDQFANPQRKSDTARNF